MSFRKNLDQHLKEYPFIPSIMLAGDKTAYGMFLFQEKELLTKNPNIPCEFLNIKSYYSHDDPIPLSDNIDFVVLWGISEVDINTVNLFDYAVKNKKPILIIEDGFIRSFFPMPYGEISASMRMDAIGCYYDTYYPSAIENLLNDENFNLSDDELIYIRDLIKKIVDFDITKYNSSNKFITPIHQKSDNIVLVIDQVYGDMSIQKGGLDDKDFTKILEHALHENPNSLVFVKQHPEAVLGIRKGHFENDLLNDPRIVLITDNINSLSVIKHVDKVYCGTTQMGFEALLCGKDVCCFGKPFYAGWGVTNDRADIPRRTKSRCIEEIFYAAYIYNTVYLNPITKKKCNIDQVISYFSDNKNNELFFLQQKNIYLELKIARIEKKVLEIEPLKEASIKFDHAIKKLNNRFSVSLENKFINFKNRIIKYVSR